MSRRKQQNKRAYFESSVYNMQSYQMYRNWLIALAMNRFRWVNLPDTCDARYLNWVLITNGVATICHPKDSALFYSTQVGYTGTPNIYDNPTRWVSFGNNGWRISCSPENAVLVYANNTRTPILGVLDQYARRLASIDRTMDVNLVQQRCAKVFTAPQEKILDLTNVIKQALGGEPAIVAYDDLVEALKAFDMLDASTPFIADKLTAVQLNIWNQAYKFLGMDAMTFKSERMIEDEVQTYNAPSTIMALDSLGSLRKACAEFNRNLNPNPDKPLGVVWNTDFISDNYNALVDVRRSNEEDA